MSYVSFEWAGEPQASESIKRVDGVEVSRNHVPGFGAWSGGSGVEVISGSHARLTGGTIDLTEALAVPVRPGANSIRWHAQGRSTFISNGGSGVELGLSAAHSGLRDDGGATAGSATSFPADGQWHDIDFKLDLSDDATTAWIRMFSDSDYSSPEYELRRFRITFDGEEPGPDFDGDTPNYFTGTTYEWAGEPHASESIKRVDGVEVARNLVVNGTFALEASHWTRQGSEEQFIQQGVMTVVPDGDWYQAVVKPAISSTIVFRAKGASLAARWGAASSPSIELTSEYAWYSASLAPRGNDNLILEGDASITHVALIRGEYSDSYFDGDTPDDYTPPTFHVRQDGEWRPALPRVFTGGAYHQVPMKQHTNGTYE